MILWKSTHFNSHAHVERDRYAIGKIKEYIISTHTLTWSVTISADVKIVNIFISTHTLTWSVTRINSVKLNRLAISTHTLTWSVTGLSKLCVIHCHFNSHAHVERDFFKATLNGKSRISTHTLTWSVTSDPESRPCPYG